MTYHVPVLLNESIDGLDIKADGIYVDLTYGGGGHSGEILKRLSKGRLVAFDRDPGALKNAINDNRLLLINGEFRFFANFLRYNNFGRVDGILADLGVSWQQFDTGERGFSFRFDSPLDMRMDTEAVFSASQLVNTYSDTQLYKLFNEYGDVENTKRLVSAIIGYRSGKKITTTGQLKEIALGCAPRYNENKYLAKVFQAIRIEVNAEIDSLKEMLMQCADAIKNEGRLVIISYHSAEDRIVKNFMRSGKFEGEIEKDFFGNIIAPFEPVNRKPIEPSAKEIEENNRARSAKLRIARKK